MTLVITILASDNARNRRRAKRAAENEARRTVTGCTSRVERAVNCSVNWRVTPVSESVCLPEVAQFAAGYRKKSDSVTAR